MTIAAMPDPVLTGVWGGGRATLTLTEMGGTLVEDCRTVVFSRPFRPRKGRFVVTGQSEVQQGGPQVADVAPTMFEVRVAGLIDGDRLRIDISTPGAPSERVELVAGRRVKAVHCY